MSDLSIRLETLEKLATALPQWFQFRNALPAIELVARMEGGAPLTVTRLADAGEVTAQVLDLIDDTIETAGFPPAGDAAAPEAPPAAADAEDKASAAMPDVDEAPAPGAKSKALWSPEDDALLLAERNSGVTYQEIAARLGRSPKSCMVRWQRIGSLKAAPDPVPPPAAPAPDAAPAPEPVPVPPPSAAALDMADRIDDRLTWAGTGIDAHQQAEYCRRVLLGERAPIVAETLEIPAPAAAKRMAMLMQAAGVGVDMSAEDRNSFIAALDHLSRSEDD